MENEIIKKADEIIDRHINEFNDSMRDLSEIGPFRKLCTSKPDFPIFRPGNKEYYEYQYMQTSIECNIREMIINPVFQELFELYNITALWPDTKNAIYVRFNNESIENVYPFEFILKTASGDVGFRYSSFCADDKELKKTLRKHNIEHIEVIDWSDTDSMESTEVSWGVTAKQRNLVLNVTLKAFFSKFFSINLYDKYVSKIRKAVKKANSEVGLETIPLLSLRNLSSFKQNELEYLTTIDYESMRYSSANSCLSTSEFSEYDYHILRDNYINKGLCSALIGNQDFARSFITSEYMYQIFKNGGNFDYTAIVSGYLKSIEQLLYIIMKINLSDRPDSSKKIKYNGKDSCYKKHPEAYTKNPKTNKLMAPFLQEFERCFDVTFAPLIWFLHDNNDCWLISDDGKYKVHNFLLNFSRESRNDHFHKDNIYDLTQVVAIRNNTVFLFYLLLGGCKLSSHEDDDYFRLGMVNDSFDRLYKKLIQIPKSVGQFYIQFKGNEPFKAFRLYDQDNPKYDNNGSLHNSVVKFVKVDDFQIDDYEDFLKSIREKDEVILSNDRVPEKIWFVRYGGEKVLIEW